MGISSLNTAVPAPALSSSAPADTGTAAAVGASTQAARGDHVHKLSDSGWIAPTLVNGWQLYDSTYSNAAMYRKIGNIVLLRNLLKSGTPGTTMFNLPVGFRPSVRMLFIIDASGGIGRIDVHTNGDVVHVTGTTNYVQISCSFVADG